MNLTEAVNKLGELLANFNKVVEPQKFIDEKLQDGTTIISYDADQLATGVVVNILDSTGQRLPLPTGEYVTQNGDTFTVVDELGTIDNVVLAAEPEANPEEGQTEPTPEAMADKKIACVKCGTMTDPAQPCIKCGSVEHLNPASETPVATPKRVIKSQVEEHIFSLEIEGVDKIEVDFSSMFKKLNNENENLKEVNKQMFDIISKIAESPVSKPTESKQKFSAMDATKSYKQSMKELEARMSKENI